MRLRHLAVVPFALALIVGACGVASSTGGAGTSTPGSSTASSGTTTGSSTTGSAGSSTTTGSGTSTTSGGSTSTSSVAATATPTPTSSDPCQRVYPTGAPPDGIPVPPNTLVSNDGNGATGEVVFLACTPGASSADITTYLDNHLAGAGWHLYNSSTDHNDGCMNVRWVKGHTALDWFSLADDPPYWQILTCDRINT